MSSDHSHPPASHSSPEPTPDGSRFKSNLEEYELEGDGRPPFILTVPEMKLLGIAGVSILFYIVLSPSQLTILL